MNGRSTNVPKKSRISICNSNDRDCISKLPESIICHILSRLTSRDAVRTSVLSKVWKYNWISIYNIDIHDYDVDKRRNKANFYNFMDTICSDSHGLKGFRFLCRGEYEPSCLTTWISSALSRNIESFEFQSNQGFVMPRSVHNNYFPNLTYLHLNNVVFLNHLSISDSLVFTFPVLKTLKLIECKWSNVYLVEIYSPALSTFKCWTAYDARVDGYSIKICGARLEKFKSCGGSPENIIMYESTVLNAVFMNYMSDRSLQGGLTARKLLKEFASVTKLKLSYLMCETIAQSKEELPRYEMLQSLSMYVGGNTKLLFELLHLAPALKFLEIKFETQRSEEFDSGAMDSVPFCVVSHLKEVRFIGTNDKTLISITKLLMKNGVKLKRIYLDSYHSRHEVVEQLSEYPFYVENLLVIPN